MFLIKNFVLAALLPLTLVSLSDSGCGGDDVHSDPDLHACHHVQGETGELVRATSALEDAPQIYTTQEVHSHWTLNLNRDGQSYSGYVYFEGLTDGDIYLLFLADDQAEVELINASDLREVTAVTEAGGSIECEEFGLRNEYPVDHKGYYLHITSPVDSFELVLEAASQYPDALIGEE